MIKLDSETRKQISKLSRYYPNGSSFEVSIRGYGLAKVHVYSKNESLRRNITKIKTGNKILVIS